MVGVMTSLINTPFTPKEKVFCGISYIPKATVQAAIGSIPLALGHPQGALILSIAVVSILLTAPLGAILMDATANQLVSFDVR
jgi:NhaP-type Na+/H+ or K+/H+ antiporter